VWNFTVQPSQDPSSVGVVRTQYRQLFQPPDAMTFASGERLGPITVAFETYGTLNADASNAIFVCHALTGDAHAAGLHEQHDRKPGWWDGFIGPGKGLDTSRYFIICATCWAAAREQPVPAPSIRTPAAASVSDSHFSQFATSSPSTQNSSEASESRRCWQSSAEAWEVCRCWSGPCVFPIRFAQAVVLASAPKLSAQGIAFNAVGRRAIYADPGFANGEYYESEGPRYGLALARMVAHITYLSEDSIELKFGRRLQDSQQFAYSMQKETEFQIESYLHYQGKRFVQRFDANSYLYLTRMMDYFDLAEGFPSLSESLERSKCRFFIASYDTDWLFPTSQSRELVSALLSIRRHVSFIELRCPFGHDSFLIDLPPLAGLVRPFLDRTMESPM
jgi:homoserine O-acetyltransferase